MKVFINKTDNNIKIVNDPELGEIVFKKNIKARNYIIRLKNGKVKVTIPRNGNFERAEKFLFEHKEKLIKKSQTKTAVLSQEIDETALRLKAHSILPHKLAKLAELHGFTYSSVKIRKSKSRWGSCSAKKSINLSLYLLLLPEHLIEYVLLHELCHTVEMNHSPAFWALLNKCTMNKALGLRRELRKGYKL